MGRADDALARGHAALLEESGEVATLNGECVEVLIDRFPKLQTQAKNQVDLEGANFSRIEMLRNETTQTPVTGMTFVDRTGNNHRIRNSKIVDQYFVFDCVVSPPTE